MKRSLFRQQGAGRLTRAALFSVAAALAAAWLAGVGLAGAPTDRSHENFTDGPFPDQICGIDGTSTVRGVDTFTVRDGTIKDNFEITQVFTATDSGKSVVLHSARQFTGNDDPIINQDGTWTFVNTFKGLPEQLRILHGPLLSRDAGVVTLTDTFVVTAPDPVTGERTFTRVSRSISGLHGPHPDLLSDFEVFCDVLIPALT